MIMMNDVLLCTPSKRKENKYKVKSSYICKEKAAKILKYKQINLFFSAFETPWNIRYPTLYWRYTQL